MLYHVVTITLICFGVFAVTRENSILGFWNKIVYAPDELPRSDLFEPLSECWVCMSSFWTCLYLSYEQGLSWEWVACGLLYYLLLLLLTFCGVDLINKSAKYFYLLGVLIFLTFAVEGFVPSVILMISVAGLNSVLGTVICYLETH